MKHYAHITMAETNTHTCKLFTRQMKHMRSLCLYNNGQNLLNRKKENKKNEAEKNLGLLKIIKFAHRQSTYTARATTKYAAKKPMQNRLNPSKPKKKRKEKTKENQKILRLLGSY